MRKYAVIVLAIVGVIAIAMALGLITGALAQVTTTEPVTTTEAATTTTIEAESTTTVTTTVPVTTEPTTTNLEETVQISGIRWYG